MSDEAIYKELRMLTELLKDGAITQEEFDGQKGALLRYIKNRPEAEAHAALIARNQMARDQAAQPERDKGFSMTTLSVFGGFCGIAYMTLFGCSSVKEAIPNTIPVTVSANKLVSTFQNNKLAAQQEYGDKKITLIGFFSSADKHYDDKTSIDIAPYEIGGQGMVSMNAVSAELDDDALPDAQKLDKGTLMQITCTRWTDSKMTFDTPHLGSCGDIKVLASNELEAISKYGEVLIRENTASGGKVAS